MLGTAAYLSPEQAMGEAATAASDRYALAVVAYELLTGTRPFEAEHFAAQARAHVEDPVPPASSARRVRLSTAVDAVLESGLAKDPADRWDSAEAFVDALERTLAPREETKPTRKLGPPRARVRRPARGAAAWAADGAATRRAREDERARPEPATDEYSAAGYDGGADGDDGGRSRAAATAGGAAELTTTAGGARGRTMARGGGRRRARRGRPAAPACCGAAAGRAGRAAAGGA